METRAHRNDENIDKLYEASFRGSVSSLHTFILNDPLILHKISLASFTQTPLHISSLLGYLDFTKLLLTQKPELTIELDSLKRSPLHLACAEGHREIVIELLNVNKDVCLVEDQDGRIPLHLAAMRGRVEVIKELVSAKPDSVFVLLRGDTVLHLCVKFNHLEALKILTASVDNEEFLNLKNHQDYTILHFSAILKQFQTTKYLLSIPKIKVEVNFLMENGFAFQPSSSSDSQFLHNLQAAPARRTYTTNITQTTPPQPNAASTLHAQNDEAQAATRSFFNNLKDSLKFDSDRFEKTRGNIMVAATLIATMSFQVAVNPPGGFWQTDTNSTQGCPDEKSICKAGTAIQAYKHNNDTVNAYHYFLMYSSVSFAASLSIILLLISGIPLRNKISVGTLILGMFISVIYASNTYILALGFIQAPNDKVFLGHTSDFYEYHWKILILVIAVIHLLRFFWRYLKKLFRFSCWLVKKLFKCFTAGNQPPRFIV